MNAPTGKLALATVATESFLPGTRVLIASFLKHHPGFDGDILVIHDGLPSGHIARLQALSSTVKPVLIGEDIASRVEALARQLPSIAPTRARFYSLEAIRPHGYDRVLFCDSDMVFLGPVTELFDGPSDIRAVGDGCLLRGKARDAETFAECDAGEDTITNTFNAGLVRFGPAALTGTDFTAILERLDVRWFSTLKCGLHDQALLNHQFRNRVQLESWRYNFLLRHRQLVLARESFRLTDIRVLHFNLTRKPWQTQNDQDGASPDPLMEWALRNWQRQSDALDVAV